MIRSLISSIYEATILILILIFLNLPINGIYLKVSLKEIQIQPKGEPREQHLGEVQQGTSKFKFHMDPFSFLSTKSLNF